MCTTLWPSENGKHLAVGCKSGKIRLVGLHESLYTFEKNEKYENKEIMYQVVSYY